MCLHFVGRGVSVQTTCAYPCQVQALLTALCCSHTPFTCTFQYLTPVVLLATACCCLPLALCCSRPQRALVSSVLGGQGVNHLVHSHTSHLGMRREALAGGSSMAAFAGAADVSMLSKQQLCWTAEGGCTAHGPGCKSARSQAAMNVTAFHL